MKNQGKITERTLYPAIKNIFNEIGAKAVQEVFFGTLPDLVTEWLGEKWLVSVKIGDPERPRLLKAALTQYMSHVLDTDIKYGMIIFFPDKIRKVPPKEELVEDVVRNEVAYFLVINPPLELRTTLPTALQEIHNVLIKKLETTFSLKTVLRLLRDHIEETMESISLTQTEIAKIITDPELFFGISHQTTAYEEVFRFLATYIFLSQVLFLRLYSVEHPTIMKGVELKNINKKKAQILFNRVLDINYRPIFEINVLQIIPEEHVKRTFKLIWGLHIEKIRYELPGRLFHALMPEKIRKLLAAFYTRPVAADILAKLTIGDPNATVFDPACGSGTILTAAYKRKLELWNSKENPHKIFCEQQIFGADIMPFAVHLTGANLAAMDPGTTIEKVQVARADSLRLSPEMRIKPGYKSLLEYFVKQIGTQNMTPNKTTAYSTHGEEYTLQLHYMDVILMNPPFTKVERGIKKYVYMDRFLDIVGGEVGLWGHFVALADVFLKNDGIFGSVIPINLLRGRESSKVRKIIFKKWLPLYIIKPTLNYGFSEWAEYRDILVIAKKVKEKPITNKVKFCLLKKDLNELTDEDVRKIVELIKTSNSLRSNLVDINSYTMEEIDRNFDNLMVFISGSSFSDKDVLVDIIRKCNKVLTRFPEKYFREGYRPVPKGVSKFMFITRPIGEGRIQEAFLILEEENEEDIIARTPAGIQHFRLRKQNFVPTVRTPVGIDTMDLTGKHDYVAIRPYKELKKVLELSGFQSQLSSEYWRRVQKELKEIETHIVVVRRINPFSPNQKLIAFFSEIPISPSNQVNVIVEKNREVAKGVTVMLNSVFFLANFFNLKEETTGRYIDIRFYDLYAMNLYPSEQHIKKLVKVFEKFKDKNFPAIRTQLDTYFEERYTTFWLKQRKKLETSSEIPPVTPHPLRLKFDLSVAKAIGINVTKKELQRVYTAIINDMITTRGLRRD